MLYCLLLFLVTATVGLGGSVTDDILSQRQRAIAEADVRAERELEALCRNAKDEDTKQAAIQGLAKVNPTNSLVLAAARSLVPQLQRIPQARSELEWKKIVGKEYEVRADAWLDIPIALKKGEALQIIPCPTDKWKAGHSSPWVDYLGDLTYQVKSHNRDQEGIFCSLVAQNRMSKRPDDPWVEPQEIFRRDVVLGPVSMTASFGMNHRYGPFPDGAGFIRVKLVLVKLTEPGK